MSKKQGTIAFMAEPGKLEYRQYDLPTPGKGALMMKILRSNVCGSELHIWKGSMQQTTLGHEVVGTVAELGEGVTTDCAGRPLEVGDRITCTYFQACGKCFHCSHGELLKCENAYQYLWWKTPDQYPHFVGTFATHYYVHPQQYFYKVPDNIPDAVAAGMNCAVTQVLYALETVGLQLNDTIVIQGAGGLGLYGTAMANAMGAKVIIIDGVETRLEQAKKLGADHLINMHEYDTTEKRTARIKELTGGYGADIAMEVTGVPAAFSEGLNFIRPCGKYLSLGNVTLGTTVPIDPAFLTKSQIVIYPINRYQPWYLDKALKFISATIDKYPYEELMDGDFGFEQLAEALDKSVAREVTRASIVIG